MCPELGMAHRDTGLGVGRGWRGRLIWGAQVTEGDD